MPEPTITTLSTATAVATATAATALIPGIDGNALVGALAGGALFVTSARDLPLWRRGLYLLVSAVAGYLAAPELVERLALHSSGLAGFVAGATVVTLTTQVIERAKNLDLSTLFTKTGA